MSRLIYILSIIFIYSVISRCNEENNNDIIEFTKNLVNIELDDYENIIFKAK